MDKVRKNKTALIIFLLPATILFVIIIIVPIFMSNIGYIHPFTGALIAPYESIIAKNYEHFE